MVRETEKAIAIPGTDLRIYGTLREVKGAPVVVICHGLGGSRNELLPYTASHSLSDAGFSTYRFGFYGEEDDARNLVDCVIDDHVNDLNLVIKTLKDEQPARPVYVAGHSLGGLTIMLANNQSIDGAILWDATHTALWDTTELDDQWTVWEPALNLYRLRWGIDILVSRDFLASYRERDCDQLARNFNKPLLVVVAGGWDKADVRTRYFELAPVGRELKMIGGADHNFTVGETLHEAIGASAAWLDAPK